MMSRAYKYLVFVFFLIAAIDLTFIASAEETTTEGIIARPVMKYKSENLRDPFKSYLITDVIKPVPQDNMDLTKPQLDLGKLIVQGIIWGAKIPQAIINNKVLTVGDLIEGAQILSIENKGITLSFNGEIFDLAAPGKNSVKAEVKQGGINEKNI